MISILKKVMLRNTLTEFNSNNTKLLTKEEIKVKMMKLKYIQERLAEE